VPRTLWSGSLSFGLVNVPVQLVSAVRDLDFHFRQLHEKDKAPIEQRRYCALRRDRVARRRRAAQYAPGLPVPVFRFAGHRRRRRRPAKHRARRR